MKNTYRESKERAPSIDVTKNVIDYRKSTLDAPDFREEEIVAWTCCKNRRPFIIVIGQ